ncbi:hypothetical protein CPC08DRAFT_714367 [Agrocybe pediades]|nr:hypothetical protein CPC08DRAFT_714367 [Agrocybe pediades]
MAGWAGDIEDVQAQTAPHTSLHQSQQQLEQTIRVAAQQLLESMNNNTTSETHFEGTSSQRKMMAALELIKALRGYTSGFEERKEGDSEQARLLLPSADSSSSSSSKPLCMISHSVIAGGTFNLVESTCDAHCGCGEIVADRLLEQISTLQSIGEEMHKQELEIVIALRRDVLWMKWVGGTIVLFV